MSKEMKIRNVLKSVFDSYEEVYDFIFTTYNYEPDFFDENIVAYLMGFDRKITTIGELKEADAWIRKNHINVYYDKNALSPGTSCLTVPVYPQNISTGVFHPKVIVIYGKPKKENKKLVHLFVSSCNLTVNGYGRNKEAFSCVEVNSKNLAESLINFIDSLESDDIENHSELIEHLKTIKSNNNDIEFLWTYKNKGTNLLEYLKNCSGNLTVVSPYFDEKGPKSLLDCITKREKTTIVPSLDGETYNIHKSDYVELKNQNIMFKELKNDDSSRFIHAKIIQFGDKIFVGSYNFTSAAIKGSNAEATLVFNNKGFDLSTNPISENKFLPDEEPISNRDESDTGRNNIFVSFTVRWKDSKIYIKAENFETNGHYSLRIDGFSDDLINDFSSDVELVITSEVAKKLLKHKTFSVYKDGVCCFKGLINEIDSAEFRPEISCESLNESLKEWYINSDENDFSRKQYLRLINTEDEETEKVLGVAQKDTADIFDNYFLVSKALENLLIKIEESTFYSKEKAPEAQRKTEKYWNRYNEWKQRKYKADNNLYGYLVTKPGSIENMLSFLEKDHSEKEENDIVYEWLVLNYIICAVSKFPKKLVHNDGNEIYQGKLKLIIKKTEVLEQDIEKRLLKEIDKNYLEWIKTEFNKRMHNV